MFIFVFLSGTKDHYDMVGWYIQMQQIVLYWNI